MCFNRRVTSLNCAQATIAVCLLRGASRRRSTSRVTMPSVPSLPMNSCLMS